MLKTSTLRAALIAAALLADTSVLVSQTSAARYTPPPPPTNPGGTSSEQPGGSGGGGDGGDLEPVPLDQQLKQIAETCNGALGTLVKIPVSMVASFSSADGVMVVPVCNAGLGKKVNIDNSQALPLQPAIAANPALSGPLKKDGFGPDNVVGVVLKSGVATLYVHKGI